MKFLLTNDDGIDAPGLVALEDALRPLGTCIVVAPDRHLSGCSHQTTTDRPLTLIELRPNHFALDGTPADCARIGLLNLCPDADWLLSGVNDGGNLGVDIFMSGTVAAAREATLLGKPAVALSQYRRYAQPFDWSRRRELLDRIVSDVLAVPPSRGNFWNVNLPAEMDENNGEPRLIHCRADFQPLRVEFDRQENQFRYRSNYHHRPRTPGGDVDVCFGGDVAISLLAIDSQNQPKEKPTVG